MSEPEFDAGGYLPPCPQVRVASRGLCPLDGYPLVSVDDGPPEHIVRGKGAGCAAWVIALTHADREPGE